MLSLNLLMLSSLSFLIRNESLFYDEGKSNEYKSNQYLTNIFFHQHYFTSQKINMNWDNRLFS